LSTLNSGKFICVFHCIHLCIDNRVSIS
jgi:hypothetical protein